jgi:uncharacterized protein (DUF934 family)
MSNGLELDFESADRITLLNLKDAYTSLKEWTDNHLANPKSDHNPDGVWMHPEDLSNNLTKYLPAFETLIDYYGGSLK